MIHDHFKIGVHELYNGDCLDRMKLLQNESIHALVTDPPAGIAFMGKDWDEDKGGSKEWTAWMTRVMEQAFRVLKPGAHGLVWTIPRTSHWTATALEDAGFEIRDVVTHVFGSGFPKSMDISKAIDKQAGAEREVKVPNPHFVPGRNKGLNQSAQGTELSSGLNAQPEFLTIASTPDAKKWAGFGTALKPASEHWVLVRKPIAEDTVAKNVLKHGTGGINIDASRVGTESLTYESRLTSNSNMNDDGWNKIGIKGPIKSVTGRFPSNFILSHNPDCVEMGTKKVKGTGNWTGKQDGSAMWHGVSGPGYECKDNDPASEDGTETVAAFECTPGCAVQELDRQSGALQSGFRANRENHKHNKPIYTGASLLTSKTQYNPIQAQYADSGGASRFFKTFHALNPNNSIDVNPDNDIVPVQPNLDTFSDQFADNHTGRVIRHSSNSNECTEFDSHNSILSKSDGSNNCVTHDIGHGFFYVAKPSKSEKNDGCDELPEKQIHIGDERPSGISWERRGRAASPPRANFHPTVKSLKLMSYLINMVTPPGGTLIDPFGGSGTTLVASELNGFKSILFEQSTEYCDIILARAEKVTKKKAELLNG